MFLNFHHFIKTMAQVLTQPNLGIYSEVEVIRPIRPMKSVMSIPSRPMKSAIILGLFLFPFTALPQNALGEDAPL